MEIFKKTDYVAPSIIFVIFEKTDMIRTSGEVDDTENGEAWNPDWNVIG